MEDRSLLLSGQEKVENAYRTLGLRAANGMTNIKRNPDPEFEYPGESSFHGDARSVYRLGQFIVIDSGVPDPGNELVARLWPLVESQLESLEIFKAFLLAAVHAEFSLEMYFRILE